MSIHATDTLAPKPFKGYTLNELRYQMALTSLKKEFCKDQLLAGVQAALDDSPLNNKNRSGSILGRMLQGLSYVDYALMAYSAFKSVRGITSFFKRKKHK